MGHILINNIKTFYVKVRRKIKVNKVNLLIEIGLTARRLRKYQVMYQRKRRNTGGSTVQTILLSDNDVMYFALHNDT